MVRQAHHKAARSPERQRMASPLIEFWPEAQPRQARYNAPSGVAEKSVSEPPRPWSEHITHYVLGSGERAERRFPRWGKRPRLFEAASEAQRCAPVEKNQNVDKRK